MEGVGGCVARSKTKVLQEIKERLRSRCERDKERKGGRMKDMCIGGGV
jgi:hypothetical protein